MLRGSKFGPEAFALVKEGQTGRAALSCGGLAYTWTNKVNKAKVIAAAIIGRVDDVDPRHGQEPACLSPKSSIGNADARRSQSVPQLKEAGPPCRRFVFLAMPRSL